MEKKAIAIIVAAGQGTRMGGTIPKQFIEILDKPVLIHSLEVFELCPFIEEVIFVCGVEVKEYVRKLIDKYEMNKVSKIIAGGANRYNSVWNGLKAADREKIEDAIVFIHDGARPMVSEEILEKAFVTAIEEGACVVSMPVKDTIVMADDEDFIDETPDRNRVWMVQTPQVFRGDWIYEAYEKLMGLPEIHVTDDSMVLRSMLQKKVKLVKGSYENIKITTPEDLEIAKVFLKKAPIAQNSIDESI